VKNIEENKIELDPKYRIQRQAMMEKNKGNEEVKNIEENKKIDDNSHSHPHPPPPPTKIANIPVNVKPIPTKHEEKPPEPLISTSAPMYAPPGVRPLPKGVPPPPGIHFQPPKEHISKKQKTESNLVPEGEWVAKHKGPITITIQIPKDDKQSEWKLNGQNLNLTFDLMATVNTVKDKIAEEIGIPANKQKLKEDNLSFLRDQQTLASYNMINGTVLQLGSKVRGGKK